PYIKVGDKVKIGQVVCIVEAMKLFNEIESEHDGVVEKVLVDTMDSIEYGQELFLVRVE
ncbi:acetyl-CoA carboxylase, biotin carboxyl carrier protein, partial [bacterium]|nr:acetyl-CoA carboxylase, biotin carboxyl carrier protein [bacterium]